MRILGGRPGREYESAFWEAVYPLYDEAFPGLSARIGMAARIGCHWADCTTPFTVWDGDRVVGHVGLLVHPVRLCGKDVDVAGIHAVCTTASHRRRGIARTLLAAALEHAESNGLTLAKLHTDDPEVYESNGFRRQGTFRWRARGPRAQVERRPLRPLRKPQDAALLADLLGRRALVSDRLGTRDSGWLVTTDAALSGIIEWGLWHLPEHDAIIALLEDEGDVLIAEVIAERLPPAEVVLGATPADCPTYWTFCPDRFQPDAEAVSAPAEIGTFMVRGEWPDAQVGVPPLWEH